MLGVDAMKGFSEWKEESSSHDFNDNMLLIGMSANASTEDQNEAFEAGMHFFASKPVSVEFLNLVIRTSRLQQALEEGLNRINHALNDNIDGFGAKGSIVRGSLLRKLSETANDGRDSVIASTGNYPYQQHQNNSTSLFCCPLLCH